MLNKTSKLRPRLTLVTILEVAKLDCFALMSTVAIRGGNRSSEKVTTAQVPAQFSYSMSSPSWIVSVGKWGEPA